MSKRNCKRCNLLREARLAKGFSQEEAAKAVGVSPDTWRAWEYGKRIPVLTNAIKISEVFGIPLGDLLHPS